MTIEEIKNESKRFNSLTPEERKMELCNQIKSAINLTIHPNICYMLNFCEMPQELATAISRHYNAIYDAIEKWLTNGKCCENCKWNDKDYPDEMCLYGQLCKDSDKWEHKE